MRVAYADPPYPGQAHLYAGHPDHAGEVDHLELLERLGGYDAFALHTSTPALRELLPLCPDGIRVLAWVKGWASWKRNASPAHAWEPVLIYGHRKRGEADKVRDYFTHNGVTDWRWPGAKPPPVIRWVFAALGLEDEDELEDLYPGSGAVTAAWDAYRREPRLDLRGRRTPLGGRGSRSRLGQAELEL